MNTMSEAIAEFEEMLDSAGTVTIAGITFEKSRILKELDPIAYRGEFFDYLDSIGIDSDRLEDDEDLP